MHPTVVKTNHLDQFPKEKKKDVADTHYKV